MTGLPQISWNRRTLLKGATILGTGMIPLAAASTKAGLRGQSASTAATPGASPAASPMAGSTVQVHFTQHLMFEPETLTISIGTTVDWTNDSPAPHTVTCDPEQVQVPETADLVSYPEGTSPWASDLLYPDESFAHTFTVAGTYTYICVPHIAVGMQGTIIVE